MTPAVFSTSLLSLTSASCSSGQPALVPFHRCCKPFSCALCPHLTFSFRKDLIIHHRSHLDIQPYFCQVPACGCCFKSKVSATCMLRVYICVTCVT